MFSKILMRRDMSVMDGNMRLAAAITACDDIREFELEVDIMDEDLGKRVPGIVYFDRKLNRLAVKDKPPVEPLYKLMKEEYHG